MLRTLVRHKLDERNMSVREAAREMGIAHTTVNRILAGKGVDLKSLEVVAKWLSVDINLLLGQETGTGDNSLAGDIALVLQSEPELAGVFHDMLIELNNGTLEPSDIKEIVDYARYRISQKRRKEVAEG